MLWLIGMMGSGKTSVGVEVAARRIGFIDTDELVTAVGSHHPKIWEHRGEGFRRLERRCRLRRLQASRW